MMHLYSGEDTYRLRMAENAFRAEHPGCETFKGTDPEARDRIERFLKYPSLLGDRSVAVLSEPSAVEGLLPLLKERAGDADTDTMMLFVQPTPDAASRKFVSNLAKMSEKHTVFDRLTGAGLLEWISGFCAERGRRIERAAAVELVRRTDGDAWRLACELEKLCAYEPAHVTMTSISALVAPQPDQDAWELSNSIAGHDKRRAIAALYRRVAEGAPEPLLLGGLAAAVRSLMIIRDLSDRGNSASVIAKKSGLHPYVVTKTLHGAQAYEPQALQDAHRRIALLDRTAKDGMADATDGMFSILLAL